MFSILGASNDNFLWELYRNPTIAGDAVNWNDQTNSAVQIAEGNGGNNQASGGDLIDNSYIANRTSSRDIIENAIRLGSAINGDLDELWLCVTPLSNGLSVYPSFTRREVL